MSETSAVPQMCSGCGREITGVTSYWIDGVHYCANCGRKQGRAAMNDTRVTADHVRRANAIALGYAALSTLETRLDYLAPALSEAESRGKQMGREEAAKIAETAANEAFREAGAYVFAEGEPTDAQRDAATDAYGIFDALGAIAASIRSGDRT